MAKWRRNLKIFTPTAWELRELEIIRYINESPKTKIKVHEVFGSEPVGELIGHGRPSYSLPLLERDEIGEFIDMAHKSGIAAYAGMDFSGNIYQFIDKSGGFDKTYIQFRGDIKPLRFYIDNKELEGFIEPWVEGRLPCCSVLRCVNCGYCAKWAKVVKVGIIEKICATFN